jgi:hypothetical protein
MDQIITEVTHDTADKRGEPLRRFHGDGRQEGLQIVDRISGENGRSTLEVDLDHGPLASQEAVRVRTEERVSSDTGRPVEDTGGFHTFEKKGWPLSTDFTVEG